MKAIVVRGLRFLGLVGAVYGITLLILIVDSARIAISAHSLIQDFRNNSTSEREVSDFATGLQRYSANLDSNLLLPIEILVGDNQSIRQIARTVNSLARALEDVSPLFDEKTRSNNQSDTEFLLQNSQYLEKASLEIDEALTHFDSLEFSGLLSGLNPRLVNLREQTAKYQEAYLRTSPLIPLLPDLLGDKRVRTYFIGMQNSAQGRGTGGLLGTFAIVTVDKGRISIDYVAPNTELMVHSDIPIEVPQEYRQIYQDYAKNWNGSNFSPHFPYAAENWAETWRRMTGQQVDGVISIDTYMLRALLAASGPIEVENILLSGENVIEELLSTAYSRFESDPMKRKNFLATVAKTVADRFVAGNYSRSPLIRESVSPLVENRILLYMRDARERELISRTPLSGILDDGSNNEYRLILQNIAGNKLDYYMAKEIEIMSEQCSPIRTTRVDIKVTNTADPKRDLPAYVIALRAQGFPNGKGNTQFAGIFLYGPTNSKITGVVDRDTGETYGWLYRERNRSLYSAQVYIPAGASKNFTVFFEGGEGPITSVLQPLVIPQKTRITDSCN